MEKDMHGVSKQVPENPKDPKELSPKAKFLFEHSVSRDTDLLKVLEILDAEECELFVEMFVAKGGYISQSVKPRVVALINRRWADTLKTDADISMYMERLISGDGELNTNVLPKVLEHPRAEALLSSYVAKHGIGRVYRVVLSSTWSAKRVRNFFKMCLEKDAVLDYDSIEFVLHYVDYEEIGWFIKMHMANGGKLNGHIVSSMFDMYDPDNVYEILMSYWKNNKETCYAALTGAAKCFTDEQLEAFVTAVTVEYNLNDKFLFDLCEVNPEEGYVFLMAYFRAGGAIFGEFYELEKFFSGEKLSNLYSVGYDNDLKFDEEGNPIPPKPMLPE